MAKEKKTRKQIFEEKWLPKFKELKNITEFTYDGFEMHINTKEYGKIAFNPEMNYVYFIEQFITRENGLKWLIKELKLDEKK